MQRKQTVRRSLVQWRKGTVSAQRQHEGANACGLASGEVGASATPTPTQSAISASLSGNENFMDINAYGFAQQTPAQAPSASCKARGRATEAPTVQPKTSTAGKPPAVWPTASPTEHLQRQQDECSDRRGTARLYLLFLAGSVASACWPNGAGSSSLLFHLLHPPVPAPPTPTPGTVSAQRQHEGANACGLASGEV
eukprot:gene13414-biopygen12099